MHTEAKHQILVLGDSHALIFDTAKMADLLPGFVFNVISVGGATVSGLENPNSATQAMPKYLEALAQDSSSTVIVMLGEVDTGFVIWYRSQRHSASVDSMYQQAVSRYQKFLIDLAQHRDVICISTPLPTIRDGTEWGEVANLRKEVEATLYERTSLTVRFNLDIEAFCKGKKIKYCNLDTDSMDENGNLLESLRNPDDSDHHYDPSAHSSLVAMHLLPHLENIESMRSPQEMSESNGLLNKIRSQARHFFRRI